MHQPVDRLNEFAVLLPRYVAALAHLEALGISIVPTSRLNSYRIRLSSSLVDPRGALPEDHVRQLFLIFERLTR